MGSAFVIHALASTPLFAARGFLAGFVVALIARFAPAIPLFRDLPGVGLLGGAPPWLVADGTLVTLGLLALAELVADKWTEARELLGWIDRLAKPAIYLVIMLGLVDSEGEAVLREVAGLPSGMGLAATAGGAALVWWMARVRAAVRGALFEADPDDESGAQRLLSWLEDAAVVYGVFLVTVFPVVGLALAALTLGLLGALRWWLMRRERKRRRDCPGCGRKTHPAALFCPGCREPLPSPVALGFLGTLGRKERPADQPARHRLELMRWKRCPDCAELLPRRDVVQQCPACSGRVFPSQTEAEAYFAHVRSKLPRTLLVCLLWSLVPVVGLVGGVVYFRLGLIPGLKRYLPAGTALVGQWGVRLASLAVLWFQPVPLAGAVSVPLMCLINYAFYSRLFLRRVRQAPFPTPRPTAEGPVLPAVS